jgi:hypothetical protein
MWDVFISHASEDKEKIAAPLADELQRRGLRIWYADFSLELGDSLRRSIDTGLARSRFGVIILSPRFFSKHWPQRELDGLSSREVSGEKVILPVWHGVTHAEVAAHSPSLADRLAVSTNQSIAQVADAIEQVVRRGGSAAETPPRAPGRVGAYYSRPTHLFLLGLGFVAILAFVIFAVITREPGTASTGLPDRPVADTRRTIALPRRFEASGTVRFSDHRPADGVEVSIPLLRLSDRTNANGTFHLGQIDPVPGMDSLDMRIAVEDTVFERRIALNAASLDIVLAYFPRSEPLPDTPGVAPPKASPPDSPNPALPEPGPGRATVREPEPRSRPEPTTGSVAGYVNAAIGGEQYKHYGMTVTGSGTCRLRGRVQVLRGGNREVHIVVLTADEYELYRVKGPYSEIFRERNTSDYTLDVELPGPGRYELVISNRTSWLTPKYVLVENVRWECTGGGS